MTDYKVNRTHPLAANPLLEVAEQRALEEANPHVGAALGVAVEVGTNGAVAAALDGELNLLVHERVGPPRASDPDGFRDYRALGACARAQTLVSPSTGAPEATLSVGLAMERVSMRRDWMTGEPTSPLFWCRGEVGPVVRIDESGLSVAGQFRLVFDDYGLMVERELAGGRETGFKLYLPMASTCEEPVALALEAGRDLAGETTFGLRLDLSGFRGGAHRPVVLLATGGETAAGSTIARCGVELPVNVPVVGNARMGIGCDLAGRALVLTFSRGI